MCFCVLRRSSRWPPKTAGKTIFGKNASCLWEYRGGGGGFCSISHRFRYKCVFCLFYTEIQDRRQKWQEINFWEKLRVCSVDTLGVKNLNEIALFCTVSMVNAFYAEIQDGRQKRRENVFWENASCLCRYHGGGGGGGNFNKISPSRTISEINAFYTEIQREKSPVDCWYSGGQNFYEITLSRTVSDI